MMSRTFPVPLLLRATLVVLTCFVGVAKECPNSTVDAWGPEKAKSARAFLATLQSVVKADDEEKLASLLEYPVNVIVNSRRTTVKNAAEFRRRYAAIVTPDIKRALAAQSADCLFGNYQGAMVGNGEIWFEEQLDGSYRVITFNPGASGHATP